jgi:hypothetical protein
VGLDCVRNLQQDLFQAGNHLCLLGLVTQLLVQLEQVQLVDGLGELLQEGGVWLHEAI